MKIYVTSVFVDDQARALEFYTNILGFEKKHDIPLGEHRWLTVVSSEDTRGTELLLEPSAHPAVPPFKEALVSDGIPFVSFQVGDIDVEYQRLCELGVEFVQPPTAAGNVKTAVLDDTCGNFVQLVEMVPEV